MRVLYLLNISNPDRLSADSGWIFADLLAPALVDAWAEVTVAAPAAAGDARCGFHQTKVPGTKYRARFSADIDELVALIRETRPDAVVANQIEEAPAIRTALLEAGSDALLAGYCHYLPFSFTSGGQLLLDPSLSDAGLGRPVLLAFAAGLAACDRVMVHSSTATSWVSAAAARMTVDLGERLRVVPAPRDDRLVRAPATTQLLPGAAAIGIYNHRLYAHYGTEQFVHLAHDLVASSRLRLRVMDLFGQRSTERQGLDNSPEKMRDQLAALSHLRRWSPSSALSKSRCWPPGSATTGSWASSGFSSRSTSPDTSRTSSATNSRLPAASWASSPPPPAAARGTSTPTVNSGTPCGSRPGPAGICLPTPTSSSSTPPRWTR